MTQIVDPDPIQNARQTTLLSPINCSGIGLHSGQKVSIRLLPAPANHGIVFVRTDVTDKNNIVPAKWDHVVNTTLCTVLGNKEGVTISTVEHLMAAFRGCQIDNAIIEITASEMPVMDGSSAPFVFLIECAGIKELDAPKRAIRVLKTIEINAGDAKVKLTPSDHSQFHFKINFKKSSLIAEQETSMDLKPGVFKAELARARTFGFAEDVDRLRAAGLAKGGSLKNAVVVDQDKILNEDGLRYPDEFVRHKLLDAVGDLYLAGAPILGAFYGSCSGHELNNSLLRMLFADPAAWAWTDEADQFVPDLVVSQKVAKSA